MRPSVVLYPMSEPGPRLHDVVANYSFRGEDYLVLEAGEGPPHRVIVHCDDPEFVVVSFEEEADGLAYDPETAFRVPARTSDEVYYDIQQRAEFVDAEDGVETGDTFALWRRLRSAREQGTVSIHGYDICRLEALVLHDIQRRRVQI